MKKFIMVMGGLFLLLVAAIAGMGGFAWYKASQYETTAVPFMREAIPAMSGWDPEVIRGYMVPQVMEKTGDEDFLKIVRYLSRLGTLEKMEEPVFAKIHTGATLEDGKGTYVTYKVPAKYSAGDATINMVLLDLGDRFQVYNFHINSMALVD